MESKSLKRVLKDIRELRVQGSSAVRRAIVNALKQCTLESRAKNVEAFRNELRRNAFALLRARPTEPEARTAVRIILKAASVETMALQELKERVLKEIEHYEDSRARAMRVIAEHGANVIEDGDVVFTHCHSHTVEAILLKAMEKIEYVIATETRPRFQGRITAENLARAGLDVRLVVDSAAYSFMREADRFFTGCDAVLVDGSIVNKVGTALISLAAFRFNVKHFVATSSHCFDPLTYFGVPEKIEERPPEEVWGKRLKRVLVRNPAFDVTDARYVHAVVSELGVLPPKMFALEMVRLLELNKWKQAYLSMLGLF